MDAEGATSQVTRVSELPQSPAWSPDGRSIAYVAVVPFKEEWSIGMPAPPEGADWTPAPRVVNRLHYRQDRVGDDGFTEPGFTHLFVVTAEGGTPRQLTRGEWHVGTRFDGLAFGAGLNWTPDGSAIVFDGLRDEEGDSTLDRSDIYLIKVSSREIQAITSQPGYWTDPKVSPDGRTVAFTGYPQGDATYQAEDVYVAGIDGSNPRSLIGDYDRPPASSLQWARDGSGVYFSAQDRGTHNIQFASVRGGIREVTTGNHVLSLSSVAGDRNQTAVGVLSSPHQAGDIVTLSLRRSGEVSRLTEVNDDVLLNKDLGDVEEIWYTSSGGARIQGWIVKPPSFDSTEQYPLLLEIHGGPFAMYNVGFRFAFQAFAANGHVVLYTNPRGSTGYGEEFSQAIDHAYPSVDYDDLMAGVDDVVRRGHHRWR